MDATTNGQAFVTGACLRCGLEARGGICAECLADLADFLQAVDVEGLQRWGADRPTRGGAGPERAAAGAVVGNFLPPAPSQAPPARTISYRRARVRFLRAYSAGCPGAPGKIRHWPLGAEATLWQVSARHGQALDPERDSWWTDFDLDLAYIAPAHVVEVLAVLEERAEGGEVGRGHA